MDQVLSSPPRQGLLPRWVTFVVRHRWQVLAGWVAILIVLATVTVTAGGSFVDTFKIPGAESQHALDLLTDKFPSQSGDSATIVFHSTTPITSDAAVKQQVQSVIDQASKLPEVVGVVSPFDNPAAISADGTYAYATVQYDKAANLVDKDSVKQLTTLVDNSATTQLNVQVGGQIISATETEPPGNSELIGIAAAMVILLIMFGSVIAMGLPIVTALVGLAIGVCLVTIMANFLDMSTFTPAFLSMIGLGVGIDYCLFIVTRYRESIHRGMSVEDAVVTAVNTAGRAVMFAGTVVAIALLGLLAMGIPFVAALGIAAATVVVVSVVIAITFLPMVLAFVGHSIDKWKIPGLGGDSTGETSFWFRWVRAIQSRALVVAGLAFVFLLLLAAPFLDLRLGSSDDGNGSTTLHTRRAYDLLAAGFGPGFNGPLLITVEQDGGLTTTTLTSLTDALKQTTGVAAVGSPVTNQEGDTAIITVIPTTSPQDAKTSQLVSDLRDNVIPGVLDGTQMHAYVGGGTAAFIDIGDKISSRMPLFFLVVIGLSVILLAAVFRSIVIPIKAALMNLLSVGAAFGVLVAVFQWGWGAGLLGISRTGPIESFLPMMLFGILFGLSTDYEVFLMTRVHEEHLHTNNTQQSVLTGVGLTARVVAAAAAIMGSVFLSFTLSNARVIKEFGLGLGIAILVDAFIVRLILLPAVMTLLNERAWYIPSWLDRVLPKLNVEGPSEAPKLPEHAAPVGGSEALPSGA